MKQDFRSFDLATPLPVLAAGLAVMVVGIAARQAASRTAMLIARANADRARPSLLEPAHGAFHGAVARMLARRAYDSSQKEGT